MLRVQRYVGCHLSAIAMVKEKAANLLSHVQLGVGVRDGCEAIIHTVKGQLQEDNQDLVVSHLDYVNTFNLADRGAGFKEVKEHFSELSHLVAIYYGVAAHLIFSDSIIPSTRGWHQGAVLATLLYSFGQRPVTFKLNEEIPRLHANGWILDNGLLAGSEKDVSKVLQILQADGPALGLHLSTENRITNHLLPPRGEGGDAHPPQGDDVVDQEDPQPLLQVRHCPDILLVR